MLLPDGEPFLVRFLVVHDSWCICNQKFHRKAVYFINIWCLAVEQLLNTVTHNCCGEHVLLCMCCYSINDDSWIMMQDWVPEICKGHEHVSLLYQRRLLSKGICQMITRPSALGMSGKKNRQTDRQTYPNRISTCRLGLEGVDQKITNTNTNIPSNLS